MQETQDNLFRVEDILHELKEQIEPLQIQASLAKDYLEYKEQLKDVEVALMVDEITLLHEEWTGKKEDLARLKAQHELRSKKKLRKWRKACNSFVFVPTSWLKKMSEAQEELLEASEQLEKK